MTSQQEVSTALAQVLLEHIRKDTYPSTTQMTILEEILPPELVRDYVNVLLEKLLMGNYPSVPMLRRVQRVAQALPSEG
jgi:hypothetical protein